MASSDVLTDPTVVPAGSWVTIGVYQTLLGALNWAESWTGIANDWVNRLPTTWGTQSLVINTNGFNIADAIVQVNVPNDTTIGAMATTANNLTDSVSVRSVTVNGPAPADQNTLQQQSTDNIDTLFQGWLTDPLEKTKEVLGSLSLLVVLVLVGYILYETKPWRYLPTPRTRKR